MPPKTETRGHTATTDQRLARLSRIEWPRCPAFRAWSSLTANASTWSRRAAQSSAIQAALDKVALGLLADHARHCVVGGTPEERAEEMMAAVGRLLRRGERWCT